MRRQRQLQTSGGNDADAAKLDAEDRSIEERREKHDAERERVSREMQAELNDLAHEAIRTGKAL
jgi:hypothetical protein